MNQRSIYKKPITFGLVLTFTVPTILMVLDQSSCSMIDGIFIPNLLGKWRCLRVHGTIGRDNLEHHRPSLHFVWNTLGHTVFYCSAVIVF